MVLKGLIGAVLLCLSLYCINFSNATVFGWIIFIIATLWLMLAMSAANLKELYESLSEVDTLRENHIDTDD